MDSLHIKKKYISYNVVAFRYQYINSISYNEIAKHGVPEVSNQTVPEFPESTFLEIAKPVIPHASKVTLPELPKATIAEIPRPVLPELLNLVTFVKL